jgi:hypothetical protein
MNNLMDILYLKLSWKFRIYSFPENAKINDYTLLKYLARIEEF